MGKRRRKYRKRPLLRQPPRLPTVFECPNCGARAVSVEIDKKHVNENGEVRAVVKCGRCGLYAEMWVPQIFQPVDVYSRFLDAYLEGSIEVEFRGGEGAELSLSELTSGGEGEEGEEAEEAEHRESRGVYEEEG